MRSVVSVFKRSLTSRSGPSLIDELKSRGLISQISQPELNLHNAVKGSRLKLYCGADPTARSLHLGNMVPLMILLNFYVRGHDIVGLVGGATGRVGDPSGRKTERTSMENDTILNNINFISGQLQKFFDNGLKYWQHRNPQLAQSVKPGHFEQLDNYEWWKDVKMLEFLAKYGRHIRVQNMLSRDSVSTRLESSEGIGFNEFTYQILQAYDFFHLYKSRGVTVQVGGGDQWGNITAGIDLISRLGSKDCVTTKRSLAYGITAPLLTTSSGVKFGKSAGNAVFIDPMITTPFDIYQYFYNTEDDDVERFLKIFTLIPLEEIEKTMQVHNQSKKNRHGQKVLAKEVTDLLHGINTGNDAESVSQLIYRSSDELQSLDSDQLSKSLENAGVLKVFSKAQTLSSLISILADCSRVEAKRKLKQGSITIFGEKAFTDVEISNEHHYENGLMLMRIGKSKFHAIQLQ